MTLKKYGAGVLRDVAAFGSVMLGRFMGVMVGDMVMVGFCARPNQPGMLWGCRGEHAEG